MPLNMMEQKLLAMATALGRRRGSQSSSAAVHDNFDLNLPAFGHTNVAYPSLPLPETQERRNLCSQRAGLQGLMMGTEFTMNVASQRAPVTKCPQTQPWEGTVPVAAYQLNETSSTHPPVPRFSITKLVAIPVPTGDRDQFRAAVSPHGNPLYGAYMTNSEGQLCVQQLFKFSQTAPDAGVFVPVSASGGHFQGPFRFEYARCSFSGSIKCLPQCLRWQPTFNVSSATNPEVQALPQPQPRLDPAATSRVGKLTGGASDNAAPQPQSEQLVAAERGAEGGVEKGAGKGKRKLEVSNLQGLTDRCHPCFLCSVCKKHWGACLPERYFKNARKDFFRLPGEENPPVLKSVTQAAKKKKVQSRHGPKSRSSGYRGVIFYKRTKRWESHIWHNGGQVYLGASLTKELAARVYDKAALVLAGPDADMNFKPEDYQEDYPFLYGLTKGQLVVYLRRESRGYGEEAKYPGVKPTKGKRFEAAYRPTKDKMSEEPLGIFLTEDLAVRAVFKEALRRSNYKMAGRIMETHHVRIVKPAPGKMETPVVRNANVENDQAKQASGNGKRQKVSDCNEELARKALPTPSAPQPAHRYLRSAQPPRSASGTCTQDTDAQAPIRQPVKRSQRLAEKNKEKVMKVSPAEEKSLADPIVQEVVWNPVLPTQELAAPEPAPAQLGATANSPLPQAVPAPEGPQVYTRRPSRPTPYPLGTSVRVHSGATQPTTLASVPTVGSGLAGAFQAAPSRTQLVSNSVAVVRRFSHGERSAPRAPDAGNVLASIYSDGTTEIVMQDSPSAVSDRSSSVCNGPLLGHSSGVLLPSNGSSFRTPVAPVARHPPEDELLGRIGAAWLPTEERFEGAGRRKSHEVIRPVARRLSANCSWNSVGSLFSIPCGSRPRELNRFRPHLNAPSAASAEAQLHVDLFSHGGRSGQLTLDLFPH